MSAQFKRPVESRSGSRDEGFKAAITDFKNNNAQQQTDIVKQKLVWFATSNVGIAIWVGLIVMIVLWLLNPPMVRAAGKSDLEKQKPSLTVIAGWGGVSAGVVLLAPYIWKMFQK